VLDHIQNDGIAVAVIQLGRARQLVGRNLPGMLNRALILQVGASRLLSTKIVAA
jgi:hypothetical protein